MSQVKVPDLMQALKLRNEDKLSYTAISTVMARYHGIDQPADRWRSQLKSVASPRLAPRGRPFGASK